MQLGRRRAALATDTGEPEDLSPCGGQRRPRGGR
jgi:hypothetical protein